MKILTTVLLLLSFNSHAAEFYFELAVGVDIYPQTEQMPEVNLQSPLGKIVMGVEAKNNWYVEYEHITSIPQEEIGNGFNVIWFNKRIHF